MSKDLVRWEGDTPSFGYGVREFARALNPLGSIADAFAQAMALLAETKRLKHEAQREANLHDEELGRIDLAHRSGAELLAQRRLAMERLLDNVERELRQHAIYGNRIILALGVATELMRAPRNADERRLAHATVTTLSGHLVQAGQTGERILVTIVDSIRLERAGLPLPRRALLPPGDSR